MQNPRWKGRLAQAEEAVEFAETLIRIVHGKIS